MSIPNSIIFHIDNKHITIILVTMHTNFNSDRLRGIIAESKYSQIELANMMGLHRNTVSQWCRHIATPTPDKLVELLHLIGWSDQKIANMPLGEFYTLDRKK